MLPKLFDPYGNFIIDEYTHTLLLESELSDLRVWYANPYSKRKRFEWGLWESEPKRALLFHQISNFIPCARSLANCKQFAGFDS